MNREQTRQVQSGPSFPGDYYRQRLLDGLPVKEQRWELAGISTPVLEGGAGPPVVLLHGPGGYAAQWLRMIPDLVTPHHVIAPDLPGHGASEVFDGPLDAERVVTWLGEMIDHACPSPPALVGHIVGGAIAARFACDHSERLSGLVLVDSLGLAPLEPSPEFAQAMMAFLQQPDEGTHDQFWGYCAFDLDRLRKEMGESWEPLAAYNLDRARAPGVQVTQQTLMENFGFPAIPAEDLARIAVPTTLVWGRHDLASRLQIAEAASARYGWPLHVIENAAADPPIEQPEALVKVLRSALGSA